VVDDFIALRPCHSRIKAFRQIFKSQYITHRESNLNIGVYNSTQLVFNVLLCVLLELVVESCDPRTLGKINFGNECWIVDRPKVRFFLHA